MSLAYLESRKSHCVWSTESWHESDIRIDYKGTKDPESIEGCQNGKTFGLSSKHRSGPPKGLYELAYICENLILDTSG